MKKTETVKGELPTRWIDRFHKENKHTASHGIEIDPALRHLMIAASKNPGSADGKMGLAILELVRGATEYANIAGFARYILRATSVGESNIRKGKLGLVLHLLDSPETPRILALMKMAEMSASSKAAKEKGQ